jgi:hypothetical protein
MTIQEAIKSGKPFYRPVYANGDRYDDTNDSYQAQDETNAHRSLEQLRAADILATDWKVKE